MNSAEANDRRQLKLLLVASRHHLSRGDIRALIEYLEGKDCGFNITLELSDPTENPELLELYRLVAIPALIKLSIISFSLNISFNLNDMFSTKS